MENLLLIDWLSVTTKELDLDGIKDLIGMYDVPWEKIKGQHGYKDRDYFGGVSIHYNGGDNMGLWLEMSGTGCRNFESLGNGMYDSIFDLVVGGYANITRIDIAYDDHTGILDICRIEDDAKAENFVSKWRKVGGEWTKEKIVGQRFNGKTVYFGSMKSEMMLRIYDKAAERHCPSDEHWVRTELILRGDRAKAFLESNLPFNTAFLGVLNNYLRFVVPDPDDTNKSRWPTAPYWANFIGDVERIQLYSKPGSDYNIDRLCDFVFRQCGNAVDAALRIFGVHGFLARLSARETMDNPKYAELVNRYRVFKAPSYDPVGVQWQELEDWTAPDGYDMDLAITDGWFS